MQRHSFFLGRAQALRFLAAAVACVANSAASAQGFAPQCPEGPQGAVPVGRFSRLDSSAGKARGWVVELWARDGECKGTLFIHDASDEPYRAEISGGSCGKKPGKFVFRTEKRIRMGARDAVPEAYAAHFTGKRGESEINGTLVVKSAGKTKPVKETLSLGRETDWCTAEIDKSGSSPQPKKP